MRVLLVEDEHITAKSIELMLRSEGYLVDRASLGEAGLQMGLLNDYDIIVLDLVLPGLDGYEVLGRLRTAEVQTPVLILSGLSEPDDSIKGYGYGADDYLTKPFERQELLARIRLIARKDPLEKS